MTAISGISAQTAALLILQSTRQQGVEQTEDRKQPDLVAVANGEKISTQRQPDPSAAKISNAIYSVNHVDVQKMKLDLYHKAGEALGIDQDNYEDIGDYADALRRAVGKLEIEGKSLAPIEKALGLDKLGLSIKELIESMTQPNGNLTQRLETALAKRTGEDGATRPLNVPAVTTNEFGGYQTKSG